MTPTPVCENQNILFFDIDIFLINLTLCKLKSKSEFFVRGEEKLKYFKLMKFGKLKNKIQRKKN